MKYAAFSLLFVFFFGLGLSETIVGAPTLKIYYFHGLHRCPTCLAIEKETKVALQKELKDLSKSRKVTLEVFTIEDVKNESLVKKYDIWGSSLLIVDEKGNKVADLTEEGFSKARTKPDEFRKILAEKVYGLLK
ncbi:MAG: nitrophenyl compound nitroreductase subunit ArsF family protein [Bacteroidales bacterium]